MPLPPLPPENTIRYYVDYHNSQNAHTFILRSNAVASPSAMGTIINSMFTQLAGLLAQLTFDTLRFSAAGSNVTNPVTSGFEGTVYGAGGTTDLSEVTSLNFIGRSPSGRRSRFGVFGYRLSASQWRITSAEEAVVNAVVGIANSPNNSFLTIDGTKALWYPYANVSPNAYWVRTERV